MAGYRVLTGQAFNVGKRQMKNSAGRHNLPFFSTAALIQHCRQHTRSQFTDGSENPKPKSFVPRPDIGHSLYHEVWHRSIENPADFWAEQAEELIWYKKWDRVLDNSMQPFTKW